MENTRAISIEGKNYLLKEKQFILKEYVESEAHKAPNAALNKKIAYPEHGFLIATLENKNVLLIIVKK